ncbi:unnamed protein product (macronuclear) [Paramecium tetraurelia]|uniref:Ubiquitin-like domain-containing protein n=1 Tax=Paramecium tetraurelia TaxID=5888 RepID=A0D3A8_PARTE|nr:uncharacterized protein GSPATT00013010001 [Paramecium tetraurelia]CAK77525.1 unnamed protein product [Paramecium tetraurelia]|eukprot:XP_001444922.1 hypothetical protein (macronuclear) [Paramecium tetraurelia strain d4-2]
MIEVTIIINNISLQLELSTEETVEKVKDFLIENLDLNFGQNGWNCYSEQRGCLLQPKQSIGTCDNDTLIFNNTENLYKSQKSRFLIGDIKKYRLEDQYYKNLEIQVEFLTQKQFFMIEFDVTIQEIFDIMIQHQNLIDSKANIKKETHEWICYSKQRNILLQFDEIVGYYPNDILIFYLQQDLQNSQIIFKESNFNSESTNIKLDQEDIEEIVIDTTIQDFQSENQCDLKKNSEFGDQQNNKLLSVSQNRLKCYELSKQIQQIKKQINDRFTSIKESLIEKLNQKEKQMTDLLLKDYEEIFQLAFSLETPRNSSKLQEFILKKNIVNFQIQKNVSLLKNLTSTWKFEINKIGNEDILEVENSRLHLQVERETTGIELLKYLEQLYTCQQNYKVGFECYSLKNKNRINMTCELGKTILNDDIIVTNQFLLTIQSDGLEEFLITVEKLRGRQHCI